MFKVADLKETDAAELSWNIKPGSWNSESCDQNLEL
jgi:hypothetical protein